MDFDPTAFEDGDEEGGDFGVGSGDQWADGFLTNLVGQSEGGLGEDSKEGGFNIPTRDAVVFIIDCHSLLFSSANINIQSHGLQHQQHIPSSSIQSQSGIFTNYYKETLEAIADFMKAKVISNANDLTGVILVNVKESKNNLNLPGIYVLQSLDSPDSERIRFLIEESTKSKEQLIDGYGGFTNEAKRVGRTEGGGETNVEPVNFADVFWASSNMLSTSAPRKLFTNRIFLFTGNDNPTNRTNKTATIQRAMDLQEHAILELFPLDLDNSSTKFDMSKFYAECLLVDNVEEYMDLATAKLGDIKRRVRQKEVKQRCLSRIKLFLNDQFSIAVGLYSHIISAKKPTALKLDASDNSLLKTETTYVCAETQKEVARGEMGYYYEFAGELLPVKPADAKEFANLPDSEPGIRLIGFKSVHAVQGHINIAHSLFLRPLDSVIKGSAVFTSALIKSLVKKKRVAIVRYMPRMGSAVKLAALFPHVAKSADESPSGLPEPEGFVLVPLPWADDVRNLNLPQCIKADVDKDNSHSVKVSLVKTFLNHISLGSFHPGDVENPVLQTFYAGLEALALGTNPVAKDQLDQLHCYQDFSGMDLFLEQFKEVLNVSAAPKAKSRAKAKAKSDGDDAAPKAKAKGKAAKAKVRGRSETDDEEDDLLDSVPAPKAKAKGKAKAKAKSRAARDEDSEDDVEEAIVPAPKAKGKAKAKRRIAAPEDDDDF